MLYKCKRRIQTFLSIQRYKYKNVIPEHFINIVLLFFQNVIQLKENLFYVQATASQGVVERKNGASICLTCNAYKVACPHLTSFNLYHGSSEQQQSNNSYRPFCHSFKAIPFSSPPALQEIYQLSTLQRVELVEGNFHTLDEQCSKCGSPLLEVPTKKKNIRLVMVSGIKDIEG